MFLESDPGVRGYQPGSPRQRAISMALSAAIVLLVLLAALLGGTVVAPRLLHDSNPTTFDIAPGKTTKSKSKDKAPKTHDEKPQVRKHENTHIKTPSQAPVPTPDVKADKPPPLSFIKMSSAEFASADIAGLPKSGGGSDSAKKSNGGGASYGPGEGPGGEILYSADWYREPTNAELSTYIPASAPPEGWGMVACQTVEHYHVDNCQIIGQGPRGSGYGRAVLDAAWQFLIIPPRINGKAQVGAWVRIRIDYSSHGIRLQ